MSDLSVAAPAVARAAMTRPGLTQQRHRQPRHAAGGRPLAALLHPVASAAGWLR